MAKAEVDSGNDISGQQVVSLLDVPNGKTVEIVSINAGFKATQRLTEMGMVPGTIVRVEGRAPFGGPVRLFVRGTHIAIGKGLAAKVMVIPLEE